MKVLIMCLSLLGFMHCLESKAAMCSPTHHPLYTSPPQPDPSFEHPQYRGRLSLRLALIGSILFGLSFYLGALLSIAWLSWLLVLGAAFCLLAAFLMSIRGVQRDQAPTLSLGMLFATAVLTFVAMLYLASLPIPF